MAPLKHTKPMKKIYQFLISAPLMGALFLILAASMGVATFIENDFGTGASKSLVYNSWWFELAFLILAINLFGNLIRFRMWSWAKAPVTLFHASFFLIVLGAAITRYFGYEGLMHIRENESTNVILSSDNYLTVTINKGSDTKVIQQKTFFSAITPNEFSTSTLGVTVKSKAFVPTAALQPVEDANGQAMMLLVGVKGMGREEKVVTPGQYAEFENFTVGFNAADTSKAQFAVTERDGSLYYRSKLPVVMMQMQSGQTDTFAINEEHPFFSGVLYQIGQSRLVLKQFLPKASLKPVYQPGMAGNPDAVVLDWEVNGKQGELTVIGKMGQKGDEASVVVDDVTITASYGAIPIELPFSLHLNDFQLERYPGSHSPSSFASEVTLMDNEKGVKENKRIFMNNILNYRGYRFYQSSYDMDELGTVLSVNRDHYGTPITYLGYLLMAIGMMLALVMPNTRFRMLYRQSTALSRQRKGLISIALLMLFSYSAYSQDLKPPHEITTKQAADFGNLWVQDNGGRVKPINSLTSEIARKLVKHNSFHGLSADQIVLGMLVDHDYWQTVPMITITIPPLRDMVGISEPKASFRDFFTADGTYKIGDAVETAYRKKPSARDKFDQEAIKVDEQVNVFYMTQSAQLFKLFPTPGKKEAAWLNPNDSPGIEFSKGDSLFIRHGLALYVSSLAEGKQAEADKYLNAIALFQQRYGAELLPSETHKKLEVFYNNINLFMFMMPFLMVLGAILLVLQFISLLKPAWQFKLVGNIGFWILVVAFALYTAGLGLRWYISGHVPFSNGYESMLYIGYTFFIAGLVFGRKTPIALSVSALFSSIILMVAHLNWMNPEITNLVPVLKSYWLNIHVAVIVASYGFLGLGALLGFVNLLIAGMKNRQNQTILSLTIDELTAISEMTITVGLYMLTVGAFLGGVWANESWGRYWGWDPKETWSMVTIMVYAFIIHMRMIPGLKGSYPFNLASVVCFSSVVMTYLGVNYYLAGMHSYAKGDPLPVPDFVYYSIATVIVVAGYAWYNENKLQKEMASTDGE